MYTTNMLFIFLTEEVMSRLVLYLQDIQTVYFTGVFNLQLSR